MSGLFIKQIIPDPFRGLGRILASVVVVGVTGSLIAIWIYGRLPSLAGVVLSATSSILVMGILFFILDRRLALGVGHDLGRLFPQLVPLLGLFESSAKKPQKP
jgi:hypothetical protein